MIRYLEKQLIYISQVDRLFSLQDSVPPKWFQNFLGEFKSFEGEFKSFKEKTEEFQQKTEVLLDETKLFQEDTAVSLYTLNKLQDSVNGIRNALKIESKGDTAAGKPVPKEATNA